MELDPNGLEILDRDECVQLLRSQVLGTSAPRAFLASVSMPPGARNDAVRRAVLVRSVRSTPPHRRAASGNATRKSSASSTKPERHAGEAGRCCGRDIARVLRQRVLRAGGVAGSCPRQVFGPFLFGEVAAGESAGGGFDVCW